MTLAALLLKPIALLSMGFVVVIVVVGVSEYYIVHNIDENNMSSGSGETTTMKPTTKTTRATTTTTKPATTVSPEDIYVLPDGFLISSATAAYQVEGAWNVSDKGLSIWDTFSHNNLTVNGDDACKSYYFYKRDVEMVVKTGLNAYRFSISWSRILPNGTADYNSSVGIQYYNNLLDELISHNITPVVTIFHWDMPQKLQDMGGLLNSSFADWFEDYANVCFKEFGSKVKWWVTFNEPSLILDGYSGTSKAPGYNDSGVADYIGNHNLLRAHARAYHLYNNTYKPTQNGSVGMTFHIIGLTPSNSSDAADREATKRAFAWNLGVYAHPVYSSEGNYPSIVREKVDYNSYVENRTSSRLPHFTNEELDLMRGAYDFIGVNHYTSHTVTTSISGKDPSMTRDSETGRGSGTGLSGGDGLRLVLNYVKEQYNDPVIMVTETGLSTASEGLNDTSRIKLYHSMLKGTLEAIYLDGCNVVGFTAWSLMDNMEWDSGYTPKYGIWQVDFDSVNRTRTMKKSGYWFQELCSTWRLPDESFTGSFTTEANSLTKSKPKARNVAKAGKTVKTTARAEAVDLDALPEGFLMGSATAAYQVEGAWNVSDKGLSIWDTFTHTNMTVNGDDACKSYYLYKRDVEMIVKTGLNSYRFSISWSRVMPNGTKDYISSVGIQYYNDLLDELISHNITPLVTIYHWDLPQKLHEMGGWLNSSVADWFEDYADFCFKTFGSKVKWWLTFNEPDHICDGYSGTSYAPGNNNSGVEDYIANHNILRAHARAYHLYNNTYKPTQKGSVGMSFYIPTATPSNASDPNDREAADRAFQWNVGVYAHPVYHLEGNYPSIVREKVDNNSYYSENLTSSRLPHFTPEELDSMRGAYDFIGVNYYHYGSTAVTTGSSGNNPSMKRDSETTRGTDEGASVQEGIRISLNYVKNNYNNPVIIITEAGLNTQNEGLQDTSRISTYYSMLKGTLEAIYLDGCNVVGFTAWSLMDNMEWSSGYTPKYGIWQVDFDAYNRTRTLKESGYWYQQVLSTWRVLNETEVGNFTTESSSTVSSSAT